MIEEGVQRSVGKAQDVNLEATRELKSSEAEGSKLGMKKLWTLKKEESVTHMDIGL